jgi:4-methyl-5(b-hydroxyethyl)-thiazole monophosphate biosynthesis
MKRVLVPLADGCEEIEAVTIIDTLRRGGVEVVAVGLHPGPVTASRGVRLLPDAEWPAQLPGAFDAIVLPGGGPGTERLLADPRVVEAVRSFHAAGRWVAAICAAPQVLHKAGVLAGRRATCYPGVEVALTGATCVAEPAVRDGRVITGRGPGTSLAFALAVLSALAGEAGAAEVAEAMLAPAG